MNFGDVLKDSEDNKGAYFQRDGWNLKGMKCGIQWPDENSKMTHPYFYMVIPNCPEGTRMIPWQPAQVDLFAKDWSKVE